MDSNSIEGKPEHVISIYASKEIKSKFLLQKQRSLHWNIKFMYKPQEELIHVILSMQFFSVG